MRDRAAASRLLLVLALALGMAGAALAAEGLRVAAVQLEVSAADVLSLDAFRAHMRAAARAARAGGADLIVFPEYTGALAALIPYGWAVDGASSAAQALERVRQREPWIGSVRDVFLEASGFALEAMSDVFGGIAAAYGVPVIAGTYFAREVGSTGGAALRNRALLYGADGKLRYSQDKVYLTEFEDVLAVEPGTPQSARPFLVQGVLVGLTICRDTFFDSWDALFASAGLWIDIKGNGEPFTAEVEERFRRAVPARLASSGVAEGLTVCLTGRLLDFVWEGPSSFARRDPDGTVRTAAQARSARGEEVLVVEVSSP